VQDHEELERHSGFIHHYLPHHAKVQQLARVSHLRETTREATINASTPSEHTLKSRSKSITRRKSTRKTELPKGARAPLEPNHTHFLFVDAGPAAEGKFGQEIALRAAVEDAICAETARDEPQTVMILIVVGGGIGTLNTVLAVLEKKRPVRAARQGCTRPAAKAAPCRQSQGCAPCS
jgi:hypothetical protein